MSAFKILTDKLLGMKPLGRSKVRWEGNIRMDLKEIGAIVRSYIDLTQDRDYWRALVN